MGRIRRGGYVFEWFIGDHEPRHVHVYDGKGRFLGRFDVGAMRGIADWRPSKKLVDLILELRQENQL